LKQKREKSIKNLFFFFFFQELMISIIIVVLSVLCVVLLLLFLTTKYLYFWNLDQSQIELSNFEIPVGDLNLNAFLIFPKYALLTQENTQSNSKIPLIIINHGWGMNARMMLYWAIGLSLGGPYACFLYEVRGHGKSQGKKRLTRELMSDVTKVIDYAFDLNHPMIDYSRVGFFGFSYGANCALTRAYEDTRIKAIVSLAGPHDTKYNFLRKPENFRARIGLLNIKLSGINAKTISDEDNKIISPKYILNPSNSQKNQNILLIHGEYDNIIHVSESLKNKEMLSLSDKNFVLIKNTHHAINQQEWIALARSLQFFNEKLK
jgi:pimeloyl-ACP methyl ester carboxylesterase